MSSLARNKKLSVLAIWLTGVISIIFVVASLAAPQGDNTAPWWKVRSIKTAQFGTPHPVGLAYLPTGNAFLLLGSQAGDQMTGSHSDIALVTMYEEPAGWQSLPIAIPDPLNVAFDPLTNNLLLLNQSAQELVQVQLSPQLDLPFSNQVVSRSNASALGTLEPQGMAFNSKNRQIYILDANGPAIVSANADLWNNMDGKRLFDQGRASRIQLNSLKNLKLRGIAYNPADDHWYVLGLDPIAIYEMDENGQVVSTRDLFELDLIDPQAMLFAPSADPTDNPETMNLFIVDSGGQIVEVSFREPVRLAQEELLPVSLVNTIDTSKASWDPSSPDPSGLAYWPAANRLLISDSEVEEDHPDFKGVNVFFSTTDGSLRGTCDTLAFSIEPTGVAVNPNNNRIYFSDDKARKIFEVNRGPDGRYCTPDDIVNSLDTIELGSLDPEGLAYGENKLFIADGLGAEVYVVDLGADGVIGGGDDKFLHSFDTFDLGLRSPEGIDYKPENRTLFIVSDHPNDRILLEITILGWYYRHFDLSSLGSVPRSGLAYAPGSQNPGIKNVYISSIGVDNDIDPDENDGKIWEISLGNPPPIEQPGLYLPLIRLTR
jgi:DNA-binding beta-propeller fold protein YncE